LRRASRAERLRRLTLAALAAALVVAAPADAAQKSKKRPEGRVQVQLLAINDFHGHLEANTPGKIARGTLRRRDRVPAGGAEYLASHVRMLSRRKPNTLVVAAGDLVGASPLLSALFHDEPTIEAMNGIGLDVAAVGNHEFDEGAAELLRLQRGGCHPVDGCRDGTPFEGARFRYLAANVVSRSTGRPLFPPYAIRKVGGVRIGFIGMTLEGTPEIVPPSVNATLRFADEAETANRYVRLLRRRKVQAIVVLLHEGSAPRVRALADECPGLSGPLEDIVRRTSREVDAFITGHTHAAYNCVIDRRRVTSAGSFGRLITRLELTVDRRRNDVVRARGDNWIVGQDVMRAPDITELIARYAQLADPLRLRVIGRLAVSASRTADDSGERRVGNLIADAQRAAGGADAAFVNPGEIRTGIPAGDVTVAGAFRAQPFGSSVVSMTLTGAQILALLKEQWCGRDRQRVLQPSAGVSYVWSVGAAAAIQGQPCAGAQNPVSALRIDDEPVDEDRRYRVAVSSMLAGGFNRFDVLLDGVERTDGPPDTTAVEAHLAPSLTGDPVVPPETTRIGRIP
jgi:5'-nucleotidase